MTRKLFPDPLNTASLIVNMPENPDELLAYVNGVFPGWIVAYSPQFSLDLAKFNEQWAHACADIARRDPSVEPQKVLIVEEAYLDLQSTTHTLIREFCKRLIMAGFVVVDSHNFGRCSQCEEVIVSKKRVEEHGKKWIGVCTRCTV